MKKNYLKNDGLMCNDGSPAGYYLRKSLFNSKTWIILLEGGNFCNDVSSCQERLKNSPNLASSKQWNLYKIGRNIFKITFSQFFFY
jgi:hypothetical protein